MEGSCECTERSSGVNSEWNVSNVLAGAANGASNNVKAAALPPGSTAVTPNSSSASSVKTVSLPATPVMKVTHCEGNTQVQKCGGNSE